MQIFVRIFVLICTKLRLYGLLIRIFVLICTKLMNNLHMSIFCCTFAPAKVKQHSMAKNEMFNFTPPMVKNTPLGGFGTIINPK